MMFIYKTAKFALVLIDNLTVNPSKLVEKCFLDLRKIFLNQKIIKKIFSKQEDLSGQEKFFVPSIRSLS